MRGIKCFLLAAFATFFFALPFPRSQAQVSFGVNLELT